MLKIAHPFGYKVLFVVLTLLAVRIYFISRDQYNALTSGFNLPLRFYTSYIASADETLGKSCPECGEIPIETYLPGSNPRELVNDSFSLTPTILLGIFSREDDVQRRQLIRDTYSLWDVPNAAIEIKFVLGSTNETAILDENDTYGDLFILECPENMNEGKTWHYFSAVVDTYSGRDTHPEYVMKADQDSWIHLPNLLQWVDTMPVEGVYFGRECYGFMAGMGYGVSYDIAQSLHDDKPEDIAGGEDVTFNGWITSERGFQHRIDADTKFIDHPYLNGTGWAAPMLNTTIMIHQVKAENIWRNTTQHYFG